MAAIIRWPLSVLAILLKNVLRPLRKRIDFERKNFLDEECRSFKRDLIVADYCFEVSSEGELEQVRPLIEHFLSLNKYIEVVFASPSVEAKCLKLARDFKEQVRVLRLPIASFSPLPFLFFQSPWAWVSAPTLLFCRYDFFPELLSFKFLGRKLILLSASGKKMNWFKKQSYQLFNVIVAANKSEAKTFSEHFKNQKIDSFDFRIPRIFQRLEKAPETLQSVFELASYLDFLDSLDSSKKLIMGSAWESDLVILKKTSSQWSGEIKNGQTHLLIVPHDLSADSIEGLILKLRTFLEVPVYEIKKGQALDVDLLKSRPGIVVLNLSGILCELYSKFSFAYVGGGYERSIHSVLEPFLSGCQVFCGPSVHRSTEYDFILSHAPLEIHLLKHPESFYNLFKTNASMMNALSIRTQLQIEAKSTMESIINEIETC